MGGEQPEKLSLNSQPALEKGPETAFPQQQGFPQQTSNFLSVHPHPLCILNRGGRCASSNPVVYGLFVFFTSWNLKQDKPIIFL